MIRDSSLLFGPPCVCSVASRIYAMSNTWSTRDLSDANQFKLPTS